MENLTVMKISELSKKFHTKTDRINFCREAGYYFPDLPGFDMQYFLQFLSGVKNLLPLGSSAGYAFNYFTGAHAFTKAHLWAYFTSDHNLMSYVPDNARLSYLSRDYLFAVLANVKKEIYVDLYNRYKEMLAKNVNTKWATYGVQIPPSMAEQIKSFIGSVGTAKEKQFRLSKRGQPIREIQNLNPPNRILNDQEMNIAN